MPTERPIKSCLQFPAAICSARCLLGFGLVGTEGARLMAVFAELIVLFDLRLFQDVQGNEVFGQGFPWEQSLPHNLERRRKLKKKKENHPERLCGRQEDLIGLYRTVRPCPGTVSLNSGKGLQAT